MQDENSDGSGGATKTCTGCGETQPLDAFHRNAGCRDGRYTRCKKCVREYGREHRKKPEVRARRNASERERRRDPAVREREREYQRRWRAKNPEKDAEYSRRYAEANREKSRESTRRWFEANPGYSHAHYIKKTYGITVEEYDKIIARGCAICGKSEGRMCLDHCHTTGKVRDCLCQQCNVGIGHFKDDPTLLARAIQYLREHS